MVVQTAQRPFMRISLLKSSLLRITLSGHVVGDPETMGDGEIAQWRHPKLISRHHERLTDSQSGSNLECGIADLALASDFAVRLGMLVPFLRSPAGLFPLNTAADRPRLLFALA